MRHLGFSTLWTNGKAWYLQFFMSSSAIPSSPRRFPFRNWHDSSPFFCAEQNAWLVSGTLQLFENFKTWVPLLFLTGTLRQV